MNIQQKEKSLRGILEELGAVVVAYSGGVDSSFLLKAAVDALGADNVLACIAAGASLPQAQYVGAIEIAKNIGVEVLTVETDELTDPAYAANNADRCFHCKSHLIKTIAEIAKERNIPHIICGNNFDDKDDFRPGSRAVKKFGVHCPLAEAKLTKKDIRELSRRLDLPTADIPASPCLASRICYGLEVTGERLGQIEEAEEFLRSLGLVEFRVRHHDRLARIEVHAADIGKVTKEAIRLRIVEKLKSLGFTYVTIDLQPFRSGSMNEVLSERQKRRTIETE